MSTTLVTPRPSTEPRTVIEERTYLVYGVERHQRDTYKDALRLARYLSRYTKVRLVLRTRSYDPATGQTERTDRELDIN